MRIEEIQIMENDNNGVINLVRDRLFWRAWERSAYLFNMHIIPYKVQHKSYKQINKEMLFIGFPDTSLDKVKRISTGQHFNIHIVSEAHIIISGMPVTDGFTEWCAAIMKTKGRSQPKMRNIPESRLAKEAYSLALDVFNIVPKFVKDFKFSLGQRMLSCVLDITEAAYNGIIDKDKMENLRVYFRLANELRQISDGWWHDVISKLETMKLLGSARPRICGEAHEAESSIPPDVTISGYHHLEDSSGFLPVQS